jgi:molybdenum cofactor cytidylyltransferase|tara:strand:- start:6045 stop:6656 length:612 start_codon:yes stop_codon:yes gene_type:complete
MNPDFGILVLAAGKASRFGSDKLLAAMPDGQPVISHSLLPLQAMAKRYQLKLCVVTRADNHALINYLIEKDIDYTLCPDAHLGMGHSIAHGIKSTPLWQGWMIALADMPNLTNNVVEALITNIIQNPHQVVRPSIVQEEKDIPSHPVYFPQFYKLKLNQLTGDTGAKEIIQQQKLITIDNTELLMDVDTPECIKSLSQNNQTH